MDELAILNQAKELELAGRQAYLLAAERSRDPRTAEVFRTLAEDEKHHQDYIERQIQALGAGKPWVDIPELDGLRVTDGPDPVFPSGLKALDVLPPEATEEDALLFGLNAEVKSYELYSNAARKVDHHLGKKMLERLALSERGHFDMLMMRYESRFGYPR